MMRRGPLMVDETVSSDRLASEQSDRHCGPASEERSAKGSGGALLLRFTVPGPPRPKERPRRGKGQRWYTPATTVRYEETVRTYALQAAMRTPGWTPPFARSWARSVTNERFRLTLRIFFPDNRRRDGDNCAKAIQDACNRVLWRDDSQIMSLRMDCAVDASSPRVEVEVEVIP
jgi:crossover junction endodeoxyribonuclease RusA